MKVNDLLPEYRMPTVRDEYVDEVASLASLEIIKKLLGYESHGFAFRVMDSPYFKPSKEVFDFLFEHPEEKVRQRSLGFDCPLEEVQIEKALSDNAGVVVKLLARKDIPLNQDQVLALVNRREMMLWMALLVSEHAKHLPEFVFKESIDQDRLSILRLNAYECPHYIPSKEEIQKGIEASPTIVKELVRRKEITFDDDHVLALIKMTEEERFDVVSGILRSGLKNKRFKPSRAVLDRALNSRYEHVKEMFMRFESEWRSKIDHDELKGLFRSEKPKSKTL